MTFKISAKVRADGHSQHYGPFETRRQAEEQAAALRRQAQINAPWLSPETNAAFDVQIEEVPQ